jgi:hypothetical protein
MGPATLFDEGAYLARPPTGAADARRIDNRKATVGHDLAAVEAGQARDPGSG